MAGYCRTLQFPYLEFDVINFKYMTYMGSIFIIEFQLCYIMALNANKYINRDQWRRNIVGIDVERANINAINNTAQIWTKLIFITSFS